MFCYGVACSINLEVVDLEVEADSVGLVEVAASVLVVVVPAEVGNQ